MSSSSVVKITDVTKSFNGLKAVDELSFSIEKGIIYGLLGPNGAGKTTTIRMMMRMLYPDRGSIEILGQSLRDLKKDRIGYLPEERGLYRKMKVLDLLAFFGEVKSMKRRAARRSGSEWLERLGLAEVGQKKVEELSKGMQQKVQFISTILHEPDLVILDEPFSGLDPVNVNILMDIILEFHRKGHTVIFSTHMMDQVEKLCREICLINKGRKVLDGTLSDIKKEYGRNSISIRYAGDGSFLKDLPGVDSVNVYGNELFLRLREGADSKAILKEVSARLDVQKFEIAEPSIHDIFVDQVSSS
ncbi:MAG: ATP-binding cassette domain-containing protein [Candidatus Latescibacterota bacterium]|nr:MAG: ATP-binding cassette domain-containing protein [Candidatus Latescibacterota bacterium]